MKYRLVRYTVLRATQATTWRLAASLMALAAFGCSANSASQPPLFDSTGGVGGAVGGATGAFGGVTSGGGTTASPMPTSTSGTPFTTSDAGQIVNPAVDPTISFNWPVDDPSPAGLMCEPGHYSGAFLGLYTSPITVVGVPIPVVGDVELTLTQSPTGEFFTITNGFVTGRADILAEYRCNLYGTLNCTTKKLEMGSIVCGYCVGAYVPDGGICLGLESHFKGPITADYDAANQAFENATWKGKEGDDAGVFGGAGIWTAAYTP